MFKLLVHQAVKAAPTSLRLSSSRQIHSIRAPYSGPPSYDMIARRFSPIEVDPQAYFTRKRQQAGMERDISIDIGDIGRDPSGYDVLIKDVKHETLETTVAEELGIGYQSKAQEADAKALVRECTGYIHGPSRRPIVPFIVGGRGEARWVFFILDSTAPLTYLSAQVSGYRTERRAHHPTNKSRRAAFSISRKGTWLLSPLVDTQRRLLCRRLALALAISTFLVATFAV